MAFVAVGLLLMIIPDQAHAWTPGTHIFLGQSVLDVAARLPASIGDLIRAFPYDYLYGSIAPDTSIAKRYAPLHRHSHAWHIGQEVYDQAASDALRAFGLGYLSHLAADVVAHNYFVPRQLALTSSTRGFGHSYWESRAEHPLGRDYSRRARDLILMDHEQAHQHLDRIISPTIFSVKTGRRLFHGMVRATDTRAWHRAMRSARQVSRYQLSNDLVWRHMALSFDYTMEMLSDPQTIVRTLDPNGHERLKQAKALRREALLEGAWRDREQLEEKAEMEFGLPHRELLYWPEVAQQVLTQEHGEEGVASG